MGGRSAKIRNPINGPVASPVLPTQFPTIPYNSSNGLVKYALRQPYRPEYESTLSMAMLYEHSIGQLSNIYRNIYAQGVNQMSSVVPWNYGDYYLGNTTMQMMPFMLKKVAEYGEMQAMAMINNAGLLGSMLTMANTTIIPSMPSEFMTPNLPIMPYCMPCSYSTPMIAPMMAAVTPLPIAFNPVIQGMFPMVSMSPVNWMTPSSFMSALTSGPMPYRPPGSDFPNNVGMVMTIPYGTPNPLLAQAGFPDYDSSYSCSPVRSYHYCAPPEAAPISPAVTYYPQAISVRQTYPVPYPTPVPVPGIQQVSVPHPVTAVAPLVLDNINKISAASNGSSLFPSQGSPTNDGSNRLAGMVFSGNSMVPKSLDNQVIRSSLPVCNVTKQSHNLIREEVTSSLSTVDCNTNICLGTTPSQAKYDSKSGQISSSISNRFRNYLSSLSRFPRSNHNLARTQPRSNPVSPSILHGQLIFDSGWLPAASKFQTISSILTGRKRKRKRKSYTAESGKSMSQPIYNGVPFLPRRRHHRSNSLVSEYDCAICKQRKTIYALCKHYSSSTISSLLSSIKDSQRHHLSSNESFPSSRCRTQTSSKKNYRELRHGHSIRTSRTKTSRSPGKTSTPKLQRQSPIQKQQGNGTIFGVLDIHDGKDNATPETSD